MSNPYEDSKVLGEYLLFHYGRDEDLMPWDFGPGNGLGFPKRTVEELLDPADLPEAASALDLGCAVGGATFHLRRYFSRVIGIDYSNVFIEAANRLKNERRLDYSFLQEGDLFSSATALIPPIPDDGIEFETGDACNLPEDLGRFDCVHAANLICRLQDPRALLERLPELVIRGGQLLIATPFTWLREFTDRENWLGSGDSEEKLVNCLSRNFKLEKKVEMPFLIREHRRKFQFSVSLGTRWRRL